MKCEDEDWIELAYDSAVVGFPGHNIEPSGSIKSGVSSNFRRKPYTTE
jgi:hypothetical protein